MSERRYIDVAEWRKLGGLQEVNRLWFHPHGWALEVTIVGPEGWADDHPWVRRLARRFLDEDLTMEEDRALRGAKETLNDVYPPGAVFLSGIWDSEDDEGWVFGKWEKEDRDRAKAVRSRRAQFEDARYRLFYPDGKDPQSPAEKAGNEFETDVEPFSYVYRPEDE